MLEWQNIPYDIIGEETKGQGFIINNKDGKEFYFNPLDKTEKGGSVIQFLANKKGISLRESAYLINSEFLRKKKPEIPHETKRPIPELTLEYHPFLEQYVPADLCEVLEVGYCKQKSVVNGRICFKVGNHYIGYHVEKKDWFFPKGFKRDTLWNIENCVNDCIFITKDPFRALAMIAKGYHNTASIMGSEPTDEQKKIIEKYAYVFVDLKKGEKP